MLRLSVLSIGLCAMFATLANADTIYNNLTPNNQIAIASRQPGTGVFEIETGDDFDLTSAAIINQASFVGLMVPGPTGGSDLPDILYQSDREYNSTEFRLKNWSLVTRKSSFFRV